jgi:hypothetical protein
MDIPSVCRDGSNLFVYSLSLVPLNISQTVTIKLQWSTMTFEKFDGQSHQLLPVPGCSLVVLRFESWLWIH